MRKKQRNMQDSDNKNTRIVTEKGISNEHGFFQFWITMGYRLHIIDILRAPWRPISFLICVGFVLDFEL